MRWLLSILFACLLSSLSGNAQADEQTPDREQRIAEYLSGTKFIGRYTMDRDTSGDAKPETYTISKVEKLPEADLYRLTTRIQYGETDNEVPIDIKILFSGNTPVITLDNLWIPGMGTFSARVLIHQDRYAGTWSHDAKGGHLYGRIEKIDAQPKN
jgi:hypothetical protein